MTRALLAAAALAAAVAHAGPPLPLVLAAEAPALNLLGQGQLRWMGLRVYDSSLWVLGDAWSFDRAFALDIRYAMDIKGRDITRRSLAEMRRLGFDDPVKLKRWEQAMERLFPDIRPGDRLVGVHLPGREARFYSQDRLLGAIPDPEFARAFFSIWLDERTSESALRARLLGLAR